MPDLCMKVLSEVVCAFEVSVAHEKGDDKVARENKICKIFVKRGVFRICFRNLKCAVGAKMTMAPAFY